MNPFKTFFYSLKRSLFEPKYYKDIAKANFWFSYKYLWFLIFILMIIKSIVVTGTYFKNRPYIKPGVDKFVTSAETFYPAGLELKINNGQLSTNVQEPYILELSKNELENDSRHFLTIDTSGSIDNYPDYNTYILATKNAVIYPSKSRNNEIQEMSIFYFRDLKSNFKIDQTAYKNLIRMAKPYTSKALYFVDLFFSIFIFLFVVFGSLFWTSGVMIGLLILVFFVWLLNLIFKRGYSYGSLYKMGMHVVTWPILITEIFRYLNIVIPNLFSLSFLVYFLIVLFS